MKKLDKNLVKYLSNANKEPKWMLDFRLKDLEKFNELDDPNFGPTLNIDFDNITYYKDKQKEMTDNWNEVENNILDTFCDLGVIKAEQE